MAACLMRSFISSTYIAELDINEMMDYLLISTCP